MMRQVGIVIGIVGALGLAGCGSGSNRITLKATRACLDNDGYQTAVLANRYLPGSEGNLRVRLIKGGQLLNPGGVKGAQSGAYIFLVFDKDAASAAKTEEKAISLAVASLRSQSVLMTPAAVKRGVGLTKNVFYYSATGSLTNSERSKVASCLR
jgi:hypothetical protein